MMIVVVLVAENTESTRSLCATLSSDPWGARIECSACSPAQAPAQVALHRPHVLLMDSPAAGALESLAQFRRLSADTRILLRHAAPTPEWVLSAARQGAVGCLRPTDEPATVARALRRVSQGEAWFGRTDLMAALQLGGAPHGSNTLPASDAKLTAREEQVLDLIGSGLSNKEIARQLDISDKTVKTHLHRVYVKLNQSGRYKALLAQIGERKRALALGDPHPTRH